MPEGRETVFRFDDLNPEAETPSTSSTARTWRMGWTPNASSASTTRVDLFPRRMPRSSQKDRHVLPNKEEIESAKVARRARRRGLGLSRGRGLAAG